MVAGAPGMTVTEICPVLVPEVARIVALPARAPVIKPVELTDATAEFALDHVIALANMRIQQRTVQHRDVAAAITDHA